MHMNIGLDIRSLGKKRTGDESYMTELIHGYKENKVDFQFFLFTDTETWRDVPVLKDLPENMKVVVLRPTSKLLWTMYSLPKACHRFEIDLLHVMYITPLVNIPEKTRVITTIHDVSWKFVPEYIRWSDKLALNLLIPLSIRASDHVLTVSKHAKHSIQHIFGVAPEKVTAIYNGGFVASMPSVVKLGKEVKEILDHDYVVYLGSLQPRKNIPTLIEAFYRYKQTHTNSSLKLVIAGGKGHNYDTRIDELIQEYQLQDEVYMPGFVSEEEKFALMRSAQAFLFVSLYEGFGIPPIEAMSFGTPCIVSNSSSLPEVTGDAGLSVSPYDIDGLAQAIELIVHNLAKAKELSDKGKQRAQMFQWDTMVTQTLGVYKSLLLGK